MYTPGNLIYFDPFYFKDGEESKRKYLLVLKVTGDKVVVVCLPSSQNHLPAGQPLNHGCIEDALSGINCYIFKANQPITKHGWSFTLDTFLYGWWIEDYNLVQLQERYTIEGVDYEIIGQLTDEEFTKVIDCFSKSAVVKRKYKTMLIEK